MATTSRFPYWFMLDRLAFKSDHFALPDDDDASTTLQANSITSHGKKFGIGFKLADPPRPSRLQVRPVDRLPEDHELQVVAAHRHVLLAQMIYYVPVRDDLCGFPGAWVIDHFLYRICPASLERLPSLVLSAADQAKVRLQDRDNYREFRRCHGKDIGILSFSEEEFVVAELVIKTKERPVLNVLFYQSESRPIQWEVKYPSVPPQWDPDFITHLFNHFEADKVIPLGGRCNYLCWVDFFLGCALICDVCADRPELQYRSLPAQLREFPVPSRTMHDWFNAISVTRTGVMKLVKVQAAPDNKYGIFTRGFTVTSWIKVDPHGWNWVQDGSITSDELSLLLEGLAPKLRCSPLQYPLVSMDDLDLIYFMLKSHFGPRKWIVGIDMRDKKLRSSFDMHMADPSLSPDEARYITIYDSREPQPFLPVEISKAPPHESA